MDVTNQVATLQDEVKLLKGEIKSILKEIRTAVLSRDNPFSLGVEATQMPTNSGGASPPAQEPSVPAAEPAPQIPPTPKAAPAPMAPGLAAPTFQVPAMPQMNAPQMPAPQMNGPQQPIVIQGGAPPAPAWAGPVPPSQPAPAPFTPSAAPTPLAPRRRQSEPDAASDTSMARQAGPAMNTKRAAAAEDEQPDLEEDDVSYDDVSYDDASDNDASDDEPIPIRPARGQARRAKQRGRSANGQGRRAKPQGRAAKEQDEPALEQPAPVKERPSWSLSTIAGLAVWAEDALATLGPRRFQFVLELATFAELLSSDARDVLASLMDTDTLSHEQDRPLNVNECLVVLRQLEAIVHGEKVIKLPRRRGIRHRRIR